MPTELRRDAAQLCEETDLEDVRTAAARSHEDDEYAAAGESDPKVFLTTSRNPSTRLTAFAKELKLVFPNAVRVNRGALVRGHQVEGRRSSLIMQVLKCAWCARRWWLTWWSRVVPTGLQTS